VRLNGRKERYDQGHQIRFPADEGCRGLKDRRDGFDVAGTDNDTTGNGDNARHAGIIDRAIEDPTLRI
jgi:hypothetical protein